MPTLGLLGTGTFSTDERPKDYRTAILYRWPNGSAPLTALLSKLPAERVDDPEFKWFEQVTPEQKVFVNNGAGYLTTDLTFTIDDGAGADPGVQFVKNHIILNLRTGELYRVTADQVVGTSITVARAAGETAAAALNDNDNLIVVGTANPEGADTPTAVRRALTVPFNYTQIFRSSLHMTRTAMKTRLRTKSQYLRSKREALEFHSIEMEKAFIFGERNESVDSSTGQIRRLTRGIKTFITTNTNDFAGSVSETDFDAQMEAAFRFGSTDKLALCGSTTINVLHQLAKNKSQIQVVPGTEVYGMSLIQYITPFGRLFLKMHPLFNQISNWRGDMLIVDLANVHERFIDKTTFLTHRQGKGEDGRKDEFLTESGLEVSHEIHHAYFTGMTAFTA
jgi:hypothetical protein